MAGESLSAYQGKVLKGEIDTLTTNLQEYENTTVPELLNAKEDKSNKTNTLNENSTETQYPNAQVTFEKYNELLNQIPTATATGNPINVQDSSNLPIKDFALLGNATQADTPTPDTPQDIHVVTGDNTVVVNGKNLFDKAYVTDNANSFVSSYTWYWAALEIPFIPKTTVTIKVYLKGTHPTDNGMAITTFNNTRPTSSDAVIDANGTTYVRTFDFTNAEHIYLQIRKASSTQTNAQCVANLFNAYDIQLEVGSTATDYEAPTETTVTLSLGNIELAKIGNYTDRIFKDSGKWYVEKNIAKCIANGGTSETWYKGSGSSSYAYYYTAIFDNTIAGLGASNPNLPICNRLVGHQLGYAKNTLYIAAGTQRTRVFIDPSVIGGTVEEFKTWLSTHNIIFYSLALTPTTTEITDTTLLEQLENILKMHTNKNVTNISIVPTGTNAEPTGEWEYRVDLGTVIGNINNAIISLGGNV